MSDPLTTDFDSFFKTINDAATSSQALGQDVPLLGADLANVASAPPTLFSSVQSQIDAVLAKIPAGASDDDIAAALNAAGIEGLTATAITEQNGDAGVAIKLDETDSISLDKSGVALDVGVPALGLKASADFSGALTPTLDATLDFDISTGALDLDTDATNSLDLGVKETVNASGSATLGPLGVTLANDPAAPAGPQVNLDVNIALDGDDGGVSVGKVTTTGGADLDLALKTNPILATDSPTESLLPTFGADLKLGYTLGADPTVALDDITVDLGSLINQLAQTIAPITALFNETPFKQILDGILGPIPILNDAAQVFPPLEELLDKVPEGDDGKTGDGIINALDLAAAYYTFEAQPDKVAEIRAFASALTIVRQLTTFLNNGGAGGGLGAIELGSIVLAGDTAADPATTTNPNGLAPQAAGLDPVSAVFTTAQDPAAAANKALANSGLFDGSVSYGGATSNGQTALASGLVDDPADAGAGGVPGLSIPLLTDANGTELEQILLPQLFPANTSPSLISYTLPNLSYDVPVPPSGPLFLPVVGPFGLTLDGDFIATLGFTVGYDTAGLASGDIAKGLYIADSGGQNTIASIGGEVDAGLGVDLGIVQAGITGGIKATVGAGLDETEVPLEDFTQHITPQGKLDAVVNVFLTIGFGPFSYTLTENIVDITIIDFSAGEAAGSIDQAAALAKYNVVVAPGGQQFALDKTTILLSTGPRAGERTIDPNDDNEDFRISNATVDANGNPVTDTLNVQALGVGDEFGAPGAPIKSIKGDLGAGDNTLQIDSDVTQSASIYAGDGNNTLSAGGANVDFHVGSGNNTFDGGSASNAFITGDGIDVAHPGAGSFTFVGSANGHNQISYDQSKVAIQMSPSASAGSFATVTRGTTADYLQNVQTIIGSGLNDTLVATAAGGTLNGAGGDDVLLGGAGNDYLIGGPGADYMDGGGGENGVSYITSLAPVFVDLATGKAYGGDATGDRLINIQDVQGTLYNDFLTGTAAAERFDGNDGNDIIDGGGGADFIEGGAGDDTIYGHGDGAMIDGGSGENTLNYLEYTPTAGNVGVSVNLATGQGGGTDQLGSIASNGVFTQQTGPTSSFQTLIGSSGDDTLRGDDNDDTIDGGDGADVLVVGAGGARLMGGPGADILIGGFTTDPNDGTIQGGGGAAVADYSDGYGVTVNLATGIGSGSTAEGDRLYGVDDLIGSPGADSLTGNDKGDIIDPGLSGGGIDTVDGSDDNAFISSTTLKLDYSQGDYGQGLVGGFGYAPTDGSYKPANVVTGGAFRRLSADGTTVLDGVNFSEVERLDITGTAEGDTIYGGVSGDRISTGYGDDVVYEEGGPANIDMGAGDDVVVFGTDPFHNLAYTQASGSDYGGPFNLDGGAGVDTLSISLVNDLSALDENIDIGAVAPGNFLLGPNMTLADGSSVEGFEILKDVVTDNGDDSVAQPGVVNNNIQTGFGQDTISPGLGNDYVDGGEDFTFGKEISTAKIDAKTGATYYSILDDAALLANSGDLLNLDYSSVTGAGVVGSTTSALDTIDVRLAAGQELTFYTNSGLYTAGANSISFSNIERLNVTGSGQNDVLVGTQDGFAALPSFLKYDALDNQRGGDALSGGGGDDILIGLSGSDTLDGGAGDDILIGGEVDQRGEILRHEIDTLTGGAGADTFVLGTSDGKFYDSSRERENLPLAQMTRAVVTDFTPSDGDKIELYDDAATYIAVQSGADTLIYDTNNATDPGDYGLIAQIENFSNFDLNASYVVYDAPAAADPSVTVNGDPVSTATTALREANADQSIAPLPTAPAAAPARTTQAIADTVAAAPATAPAFSVTQDANPADLEAALVPDAAAVGIDPSSQTLTLSGNGAAFGTFANDPFGLGSGIVISTGAVTDIVGQNTYSTSASTSTSKTLTFVNIGTVKTATGDDDVVYRADLSNFGADLSSLVLTDGNTIATDLGGSGVASGFDLDGIALSHTEIGDLTGQTANATLNNQTFLPTLNVFNFTASGLQFTPGAQKPSTGDYPNGPNLLGARNGLVDNANATLGTFDGTQNTGALSLGDGGSLGFNLTQSVSTSGPLYLYIAEAAGGGTGAGETISGAVNASSAPLPTSSKLSTDFGPTGPQGDATSLTYTFSTLAGADVDSAFFTFALFTQALPTLAGQPNNDTFDITLNGVELATLSNGDAATINNLEKSPYGVASDDLVLNTADDAPAHDITAVNAYTKPLSFVGKLNPAGQLNTLVVKVADAGDGLLDSGILIKGGTFRAGAGEGAVTVGEPATPLIVGGPAETVEVTLDPGPLAPTAPVSVVITPQSPLLDFGAGAGQPQTVTFQPGGPYTIDLSISAVSDGVPENGVAAIGDIAVTSADARFNSLPVAPLVVDIASDAAAPIDYHWSAPVSGDFATSTDWTPTGTPGADDNAFVDATGTSYAVTVSNSEAVAQLTIAKPATVVVADGATLTIGDDLIGAGGLVLNASADTTTLRLGSDDSHEVFLKGGGAIALTDNSNNLIEAASQATILDNVDDTISGAGEISGDDNLSLVNEKGGLIDAFGGSSLTIGAVAVTNQGLLEATNAGDLVLANTAIANSGGVISAIGTGAFVDLDDDVLRGGTLSTSAGGLVRLDDLVTFEIAKPGDATAVTVAGAVAGSGGLLLEDGTTIFAAGATLANASLTVSAGATAEIKGALSFAGALENDGTVALDPGADFDASGAITGSGGAFALTGNATLTLAGAVAATQAIAFSGRGGELVMGTPGGFKAPITGFAAGDTLDLSGQDVVSVQYDGSTLTATLSDATTETFSLAGSVSSFALASDNEGGTLITAAGPFRLPYVNSISTQPYNGAPSTVTFTVSFSGLAIGFNASNVALSGIPGAAVTGITTTDDINYNVSVSTGTGSGDLQIRVVGAGTGYFPNAPVAQEGTLGQNTGAYRVVAASLTGAGSHDVVAVDGVGTVQALQGNADGTFANLSSYALLPSGAEFADPTGVAVGDFNGDGKDDLAVSITSVGYPGYFAAQSTGGAVAILTGNGDGTFQAPQFLTLAPNIYPNQIVTGDFNDDGKLDLATIDANVPGGPTNAITYFQGLGGGKFAPGQTLSLQETPEYATVGDLTGQGRADVVISTNQGLAISLNGLIVPTYLDIGAATGAAVIGDVNGDGKADIVAPTSSGLAILLGNGDGTFSAPTYIHPSVNIFEGAAIADVTGDGVPDIVASTGEGMEVLIGKGDGTFSPGVSRFSSNGYDASYDVALSDVNGDGAPDVILPVYSTSATQPSAPIDTFLNSDGPTGAAYIDRTPATATIYAYSNTSTNVVEAEQDVYITLSIDKAFTTTGPIYLQLNNGVTVGGQTNGEGFSFDYQVKPNDGEDTPDLQVTGLAAGSGEIVDYLGNTVAVSGDTGFAIDSSVVPCFCRGVLILTDRGEVAVEALEVGDNVVTQNGRLRPIVWIGRRKLDLTRHPRPNDVQPIRISAHAFGPGLPLRDLDVSPGHNIAFEEALMPASLLVNGLSVRQLSQQSVEYFHVELDAHDVLFADGLPTESYLDTGNRAGFANGSAYVEAHPDFAARHWADTCLPLVHDGEPLARAKAHLLAQLAARGCKLTNEADAHILADGLRIDPMWLSPTRLAFAIPEGWREIALCSRTFTPAHVDPTSRDTRVLGLCVSRLAIDGDDVALRDEALVGSGWHDAEGMEGKYTHRWTSGIAGLPRAGRVVVIDLGGQGMYRDDAPEISGIAFA